MRKTILALSLAATALASPLLAQGPADRMRPDANGDGVVTRAEAAAQADARFAAMDTDRNGTVTVAERRAERERMRAERDARVVTKDQFEDRAGKRFDRMDANDDGKLTGEERRMGKRGHRGPDMGRPGRRGPGGLGGPGMKDETAAQFRARALERFDRMDANRDGRIDQVERAAERGRRSPPPGGPTPPPPPAK